MHSTFISNHDCNSSTDSGAGRCRKDGHIIYINKNKGMAAMKMTGADIMVRYIVYLGLSVKWANLMNEYETIDVFCDREHASLHYGRCSIL